MAHFINCGVYKCNGIAQVTRYVSVRGTGLDLSIDEDAGQRTADSPMPVIHEVKMMNPVQANLKQAQRKI